jgi:hypothetical protein
MGCLNTNVTSLPGTAIPVKERPPGLEERRSELSKLARFGGGGKAIKFGRGGPKGAVAPKYRNPEDPSETWDGRGLKPRWLSAAIKGGKTLEDFAIGGSGGASGAREPKKIRKMRNGRK